MQIALTAVNMKVIPKKNKYEHDMEDFVKETVCISVDTYSFNYN